MRHWGFLPFLAVSTLVPAPALAQSAETVVVVGTGACDDPTLVDHVRTVREALTRRLSRAVRSEDETISPLGGLPRGSLSGAARLVDEAESDIVSNVPLSRAEYIKRDQRALEALRAALDILMSIPPIGAQVAVGVRIEKTFGDESYVVAEAVKATIGVPCAAAEAAPVLPP